MFSFISMNWKGEPLVSFETVVKMISATKTQQGLKIKAPVKQASNSKCPFVASP